MKNLLAAMALVVACSRCPGYARVTVPAPVAERVGQPADIAPSAYAFRADRPRAANAPESWIALMHYAGMPLNRPVDVHAPAIRRVLAGFLWEEIRPVDRLELTWRAGARRPGPSTVVVTALMNQGASSSWWNNLLPATQRVAPTVSADGRTYTYALGINTCGIVVSVAAPSVAARFDVPAVHVLEPYTWKRMGVEVEWGFSRSTGSKDYSGRVEAYDGRISRLVPLAADRGTVLASPSGWRSRRIGSGRRGVRMTLLYIGTSRWRRQQPYTSQADDVARTIVTVWTKAGSFSFLAADLEHGPILAPEYGFFVRRIGRPAGAGQSPGISPTLLDTRMDSVAGSAAIRAWGTEETPWFGANPTSDAVTTRGITLPANSVAMHPGQSVDVVAEWRSPIAGVVHLTGSVAHAQAGGNGIEWKLARDRGGARTILGRGATNGTGSQALRAPDSVTVQPGDALLLIVGPKGDHRCDTTIVDWTIAEAGGARREWNLARDVGSDVQAANPHPDVRGVPGVWRFCSETPMSSSASHVSLPPVTLVSDAPSAAAFIRELRRRQLQTVRQRVRAHPEQTWEAAVRATRGDRLPPIPEPPPGQQPSMQVDVPSVRLAAQWKLGKWHLVRHCAVNPATGKPWFNDYPYGILAAETYLVLAALDDLGAHDFAAAGFDQWLSLPMQRQHPVGDFSEGYGALTYATGPDGFGGQMDGIHAFGPGSIGWALVRHYWLTGDRRWLKAGASRIEANAAWMLRQRRLVASLVPGGSRLWCKGLQPALQVTPDSGGLWMQFYEAEGYYWASVAMLGDALADIDPAGARRLRAEAGAYRRDLRAAVDRSIALSPVVPVRDGTYHSVVPFACYVRGLATGAWGWMRDGSGAHVGPLYWDTVQTAAALVSPAGLLPATDVRVHGYLDVLEDRLLLENANVGGRNWFDAGWQYQAGLERTANMHLAAGDAPLFLRDFLNGYAVDILPDQGYVFNEHAVHGPPDKIFEEAAFLERFRNMLVMEDGHDLWLARGTPRAWLAPGKHIAVTDAPTRFGAVSYRISADAGRRTVTAVIQIPRRRHPDAIHLRVRLPGDGHIRGVEAGGRPWRDFDAQAEVVNLRGLAGRVEVRVRY